MFFSANLNQVKYYLRNHYIYFTYSYDNKRIRET